MADKIKVQLSKGEAQVFGILASLEPATVGQVHQNLPDDRNISYATVQTMLRRLEKKGYINHVVKGKAHLFSTLVEADSVKSRSVKDLVNNLFGGDPLSLVLHLAGDKKLKASEIKKLKALLEKEGE